MKKVIRVLWCESRSLDSILDLVALSLKDVVELELIRPEAFPAGMMIYHDIDPAELQEIARLTATDQVDLCVIGNNLGSGVERVRQIHRPLRAKTVITFNTLPDPSEALYRELGCTRFVRRLEASRTLVTMIREIFFSPERSTV